MSFIILSIQISLLTIFVQLSSQCGPFLKYYIIYYFYNLVYNFIVFCVGVHVGYTCVEPAPISTDFYDRGTPRPSLAASSIEDKIQIVDCNI